jgi:hypothetical protein
MLGGGVDCDGGLPSACIHVCVSSSSLSTLVSVDKTRQLTIHDLASRVKDSKEIRVLRGLIQKKKLDPEMKLAKLGRGRGKV